MTDSHSASADGARSRTGGHMADIFAVVTGLTAVVLARTLGAFQFHLKTNDPLSIPVSFGNPLLRACVYYLPLLALLIASIVLSDGLVFALLALVAVVLGFATGVVAAYRATVRRLAQKRQKEKGISAAAAYEESRNTFNSYITLQQVLSGGTVRWLLKW